MSREEGRAPIQCLLFSFKGDIKLVQIHCLGLQFLCEGDNLQVLACNLAYSE